VSSGNWIGFFEIGFVTSATRTAKIADGLLSVNNYMGCKVIFSRPVDEKQPCRIVGERGGGA
jgi:hypothetical protein